VTKAIPHLVLLSVAVSFTFCAAGQEKWVVPRRVHLLRQRPAWPQIQAAAQHALAGRTGDSEFARDAFYRPIERTNGVWFVTVSGVMYYENHYASFIKGSGMRGGYPRSLSWDAYDLRIRDNGQVLSYASRRETQYDAGWVSP
jgi:hypothetical protein